MTSGSRRREAGLVNAKQPGKWHSSTYRADYITNYFYFMLRTFAEPVVSWLKLAT